MKILITGAAGFLGVHLTNYLYKKGYDLILLDIADFDPEEYPNRAENNSKLKYVKEDVRDTKVMELLIRESDLIVHAAAALPLWSEHEIFDTNVNGTKNVLKLALESKSQHFIFISSTAVYGVPKVHPIFETSEMIGVGAYGKSKIIAEELCYEYRQKGLTVTVIRPKTFIGTHRLGVFEILFDWIKDGKKIPIIGSGENKYQLMDVDDLTEVLEMLISFKDKKKINDAYNTGAKDYQSVNKDLSKLFEHANSGSTVLPLPGWPLKKALWVFEKLHISPLYQWIYDTADKDSFVSIDKICSVLNYTPKFSNSDSLIKSYDWYIKNYQKIKSKPAGVTHTAGWKQGILALFKHFL